MDFQQAEAAYKQLRDLLAANKISPQEFSNRVKSLTVREESGFIWQIRETDGSWMRWNGSLWEQVHPPHRAPSPYQKTAVEEPARPPAKPDKKEPAGGEEPAPESLLGLLKLILRQLLKRLPLMILIMVVVGVVSWALQFIFMAFVNDGFRAGGRFYLDWLLLIRGRGLSGLILYFLLGMILSYFISLLLRGKLFEIFSFIGKTPSGVRDAFTESRASAIPLMLGGGAVALFLGSALNNPLVSIQLAFIATFELIKNKQSLLGMILRLGWSDLQRLFQRGKPPKPLSLTSAVVITTGLVLGFITAIPMSTYLPLSICGGVASLVLFGIAFAFFFNQRGKPISGRTLMILLFVIAGLAISASPVSADDGGWTEFGGTFLEWIFTIGAVEIMLRSLGASFSTILGTMIGVSLSNTLTVLDPGDFWDSGEGKLDDDLGVDSGVDADQGPRRDDVDQGLGRDEADQGPGRDDIDQGSGRDDGDSRPETDQGPGRDDVDSMDDTDLELRRDEDGSGVGADQGPGRDDAESGSEADQGPGRDDADQPEDVDDGLGIDDILNHPVLDGNAEDNQFVYHDGGEGPALCDDPFGLPNYWINTATLQLVVQDTIFTYQGLGLEIKFTLTYNASKQVPGMFGKNWGFSYESCIVQEDNTIYLQKGSGQRLRFRAGDPHAGFPSEATSLDARHHRLLDYGRFWMFIEKNTRLNYRYDKQPGSNKCWLVSVSDFHDNTFRLNYSIDGTLNSVTDTVRRSTIFEYDQQKRCISLTTPHGKTARFDYDDSGALIQVIDLLGIETHYEYEDHSLVRMIVDSDQKTTQFTYQDIEAGRIVCAVTNSAGHITQYEMTSLNPRKVTITDPEGNARIFAYRNGLVQKVIDPQGIVHEWAYERGLPKFYEDPNGHITRYRYDEHGNVTSITDPRGNTGHFVFDEYDNLTEETNALGQVIRYSYDEHHRLSQITFPSGEEQTFEYDPLGQLIASTDLAGRSSIFEYERYGNLSAFTLPSGAASYYGYDDFGLNLTNVTDGRGNTTHFEYDANSRPIKQTHPDGSSIQINYGCCARSSIIDENGSRMVFRRDPLLNITGVTDPLGNVILKIYDHCGNLVEVIDAIRRSTMFDYDDAGRVIRQMLPTGQELNLHYDLNSNLVLLVDPLKNAIGYSYDPSNNLTQVKDAAGNCEQFIWDPLNRLVGVENARAASIKLSFDDMGNITEKTCDGAQVARFKYDAVGNLVCMKDASGTTTFTNSVTDRVTAIQYPDGKNITFAYDGEDNLTALDYPTGLVVEYEYDSNYQVIKAAWNDTRVIFQYDPGGNLISESRSNSTESSLRYNANNMLVEIEHGNKDGLITRRVYIRDAVGNIIDESGTLHLESHLETLDQPVVFNDVNQVVSCGEDSYTYDADGNLTGISAGKWDAVYDVENRLVELRRNGRKSLHLYNGLSQRVQSVLGDRTKQYYYDSGGLLLCEGDMEGRITACYIYRDDQLIARVNADGETQFYHFDKTGNTLALTDGNGKVCASYAYEPFGAVSQRSDEAGANPFTYVGQFGVMDEGDGLYYMTRRYYDAHTGRFVQKDPIGIDGGFNLFAYTLNNPVTGIDPDGTIGFTAVCLAFLVVAGVCAAGYALTKKIPKTSFGLATQKMKNPSVHIPPSAAMKSAQETLEVFGLGPIEGAASATPGLSTGTAVLRAANSLRKGNVTDAALTAVSAGHPNDSVRDAADALGNVKAVKDNCP